jgi:UPF0271 protein
MYFDLNCDLGEGAGNDGLIMPHITSVNIACGGHAGNPDTMRETVVLAIASGVRIGAHPGYPDPERFGRASLEMSLDELSYSIVVQIRGLIAIATEMGAMVSYVKPHGALYNDAAVDSLKASVLVDAVRESGRGLAIMGLPGSALEEVAEIDGTPFIREGFADRTYGDDGKLVPRGLPGAIIEDPQVSILQVENMIGRGRVFSQSGRIIPVRIDSVCLHGDHPGAPRLAALLAERFIRQRKD